MKKTLIILLSIWGFVLTGNIQAENLENNNSVLQIIYSENLPVSLDPLTPSKLDPATPSDLNAESPLDATVLMILVIIGFFFARKHQSLARKHQDLTKTHKTSISSDSILDH